MKKVDLQAIKGEAMNLYLNGDYYCSEAIIYALRKHLASTMPVQAVAMASGFPLGIGGAGCLCGALSGGVLALGYFFGRTTPKDTKVNKAMALSKELHDFFQEENRSLCCRDLVANLDVGSPEQQERCAAFTGEVAYKTAQIICRELGYQAS